MTVYECMIVVYLFLCVIAIFSYFQKKYVVFLVCYLGLMTHLFMLDHSEIEIIRGSDLCLFMVLFLLPFVYRNNKDIFKIRGDRLTKWIYVFMAFYWAEFFFTVISGTETFFNSLKVIRVSFFLWSFFIFRSIPLVNFGQFLMIALKITIIQSFLFFLQYAGINILAGNGLESEASQDLGFKMTLNTPLLTMFYVFYAFKAESLKGKRLVVAGLMIAMTLLTFVRGRIISLFIGIVYYIIAIAGKKQRRSLIIGLVCLLPLVAVVITQKSEGSGGESASSQITEVVSNVSDIGAINKNSGTFTFRFAMLAERIIYLVENPEYLLTGVGTMHEDSPRTIQQFDFVIGTINEDRALGRCLIESGDITWVPIVLRYGLIGVLIHLMILLIIIQESRKRKDLLVILSAFYIVVILGSFNGSFFENPTSLFLLALFYAIISRAKLENKKLVL